MIGSGGLSPFLMRQKQFARADRLSTGTERFSRRRLAFDGNAINHSLPDRLFANGVLGNLAARRWSLAREKRFGGFNLDGRPRPDWPRRDSTQPGFAGIFVTLGDGDRNAILPAPARHRPAWTRAPVNGIGCERWSSTVSRSHGQAPAGMKFAAGCAVRLAENRLALSQGLPMFAVGGTLDAHGLDEIRRRGFQRHAVERLGQAGFQHDDGRGWRSAKPEMILHSGLLCVRDLGRAFDQIRHFSCPRRRKAASLRARDARHRAFRPAD